MRYAAVRMLLILNTAVLPDADATRWTTTHVADRHGGRRRGWSYAATDLTFNVVGFSKGAAFS